MDKPVNMTVKDFLVRKMAVKMRVSEKVLQAVIAHQFKSADEAIQKHCKIELSGFGTFLFNYKKAHKKMAKLINKVRSYNKFISDESNKESSREMCKMYLNVALRQIEYLKPRINVELFPDLRGLEEQLASSQGIEAEDSSGEQNENDDMRSVYISLGSEEGKAELQNPAS